MLADFYGLVDDLIRDREQVIKPISRDRALDAAVQRFSTDKPRDVVEDVTVLATGYFLPMPSQWVSGYSILIVIEADIGASHIRTIAASACAIYTQPGGPDRIRLPDNSPQQAGAVLRVRYSAPHQVNAVADTVPHAARHALASYAAGILCAELAAHYAGDSDSTIQADSVDHRSKSQTWNTLANRLKGEYFKFLGIESTPVLMPASAQVSFAQRKRFPAQRTGQLL